MPIGVALRIVHAEDLKDPNLQNLNEMLRAITEGINTLWGLRGPVMLFNSIDLQGKYKITNTGDPSNNGDLVNLGYANNSFSTQKQLQKVGFQLGLTVAGVSAGSGGGSGSAIAPGAPTDFQNGGVLIAIGGATGQDLNLFWSTSTESLGIRTQNPSAALDVNGSIAISLLGGGLKVKEGANARMGLATLAGGTVVVANTTVTTSTRIFLSVQTPSGTQGFLSAARLAGVSFTINSTNVADTSDVAWLLCDPA